MAGAEIHDNHHRSALLASYLFTFLLALVLWAQSRSCRQGASCGCWLGECLFSWMQLYQQSVHITSDKDFQQSTVVMKTSPLTSLSGSSQDWKAGSSYSHRRKQCWCVVQHLYKAQLVVTGSCVWNGWTKPIGLIMDATDSGIDAEARPRILC